MQMTPNAIIKVAAHENVVHGIFFQDPAMRIQYEHYPEILFCDATYNISRVKMALQVLMVVDGNGDSQIVALCLIDSENITTMTTILSIFCSNNPGHNRSTIIMVDKNAANLASFRTVFPQAAIHLCIFHVQQIFQREITVRKLKITERIRNRALEILKEMIYCRTPRQYQDLYGNLTSLNAVKLTKYFNTNWHSDEIRPMWVGH